MMFLLFHEIIVTCVFCYVVLCVLFIFFKSNIQAPFARHVKYRQGWFVVLTPLIPVKVKEKTFGNKCPQLLIFAPLTLTSISFLSSQTLFRVLIDWMTLKGRKGFASPPVCHLNTSQNQPLDCQPQTPNTYFSQREPRTCKCTIVRLNGV